MFSKSILLCVVVCALMAGVVEAADIPPEVKEFCEKCPKGPGSQCVQKDGNWKCKNDGNGETPCGCCLGVCASIPFVGDVCFGLVQCG